MTNRRRFLTTLIGGAVGAMAFDPELALFVPGAKLISIPKIVTKPFVANLGDMYFGQDGSLYIYGGTNWMEFVRQPEGFIGYQLIRQLPDTVTPVKLYEPPIAKPTKYDSFTSYRRQVLGTTGADSQEADRVGLPG